MVLSVAKSLLKVLKIFFVTLLFWFVNISLVIFYWLVLSVSLIFVFSKRTRISLYQKAAKSWGKILSAIAAPRMSVMGLENIPKDKPVIYTPNHQGNLDWMILLAILPLPFRFVIKKELFKIPLFGNIIKGAGYFSLDREAKRKAYDTLVNVIEIARKESVVIFPEGTRTWDGKVGEFKRGGFLLAFEVGNPIIPVAISGSFDIMPRYTWIIKPGEVRVKIGPPISLEEFREERGINYRKAIEKVRGVVETMLSEIEHKH